MLFLGIDGGGTKTECAIADEWRIVSRASAGSCKIREVGEIAAWNALRQCVQQALAVAGVSSDRITAACAGLAGASHPDVVAWATTSLSKTLAGTILIVGDHLIAHEAAFGGKAGVLVISGTGSIAYGRNVAGAIARAGGHGPDGSDEGSARWIVRNAAESALRNRDSELLLAMAQAAGLTTASSFEHALQSGWIPELAVLAPAVLAAAEEGETTARNIIAAAGEQLAILVMAVIREIYAADEPVPVCIAGGLLQNSPLLRDSLRDALRQRCPAADLDCRPVDPIEGALYLARQQG